MEAGIVNAHGTRSRYRKGCRCGLCRAGNREHYRAWRAANLKRVREYARTRRAANLERARESERERGRVWRAANPEHVQDLARARRSANPEHARRHAHSRRVRLADNGGPPADASLLTHLRTLECVYCGTPGPREIDHITAITRGGTNDEWNLAPACKSCNSAKRDKNVRDWLIERAS